MKILVSALESSANLHLQEILEHLEEYELTGIFDERFGKPLYSSNEFGVMGVIDAVKIYKKAKLAIEEMAKLSKDANVLLMIDSPAFNVPLAKRVKEINPQCQIFYYILPQVWAWKKKRVEVVESVCDRLFAILPFEEKFWNKAEYVGNPLMDEIKQKKESINEEEITAFLPGSRRAEIKKLMPIYKEVAKEIDGKKILVIPEFFPKQEIETIYGDIQDFEVSFDTKETIYRSKQAIICSGTATLEAAIIGTPFVLVYKAKPLDYFIGRSFVRLPFVGLANLIFYFAGKEAIHEELLQSQVTKVNILKALKVLDRDKFLENVQELRSSLAAANSSKSIATALIDASRKNLPA